jgi:hypothetical protein
MTCGGEGRSNPPSDHVAEFPRQVHKLSLPLGGVIAAIAERLVE